MSRPLRTDETRRLAGRTVGHLSRCLNRFGLLLFAIFAVLVPVSAGAQEPPAPSSASVWYAAGTSLVRVDAESGQARFRTIGQLEHALTLCSVGFANNKSRYLLGTSHARMLTVG